MNGQTHLIRRISPYIHVYLGKTFVIKIGGSALANAKALANAVDQCKVLADLGIRLILVHGGGTQVTAWSRQMGAAPTIIAGRRVTDDVALEAIKMVLAGKLNTELVSALARTGARPVGLTGLDARLVTARKRPPTTLRDDDGTERTVDFGHVGDIEAVDCAVLDTLLGAGFIPVISCLAGDAAGQPLNVNADVFAESLAVAAGAEKLIFLTDQPGVLRDRNDPASLVPFADAAEIEQMLASGALAGGMRVKVEACVRAATHGVRRTHVISGFAPDALLTEVFTGEGCGTMIVNEKEKQEYQAHELG